VWNAAPAVDVQAGVRLDRNEVFGTFHTWRGGFVVRPAGGLRLHGAVGTAFKAPTFSEQFADTPFERGDPGLSPERVASWEAGVEAGLANGRFTGTATWFDQRFRDLIQYVAGAPDEPTYVNVGRAGARGLELAAGWTPLDRLALHTSWTGLRTRVQDAGGAPGPSFRPGSRLLRRPASTLAAGVRWRPGESVVTADVQRVGARDDVDFTAFPAERVTLPGYTLVHLSADVPLRRAFAVTLAVRNLFDEQFESVVRFPGIGRVVMVGGRWGR
jgi:vitamin B12 transporter